MKQLKSIVLALLFSGAAYASIQAFNSSSVNIGHFADIKAASGVAFTNSAGKLLVNVTSLPALTGDVVGDGGDQLVGFLQNQVTASTTALTAAQCGSTVISAAAVVQPLPEASTVLGCRYTFVCGTADDFDIDPADGTDVIGGIASVTGANTATVIAPSAGDEVRCTDIGSSVTLEAVAANLWAAIGASQGIWTDVN